MKIWIRILFCVFNVLFVSFSQLQSWCCLEPYGHCSNQLIITQKGQYLFLDENNVPTGTTNKGGKVVCSKCEHPIVSHLCMKDGTPEPATPAPAL